MKKKIIAATIAKYALITCAIAGILMVMGGIGNIDQAAEAGTKISDQYTVLSYLTSFLGIPVTIFCSYGAYIMDSVAEEKRQELLGKMHSQAWDYMMAHRRP